MLGQRRGKNLQKEVCREKQLNISEAWKDEMESGDSEQAGEVIDGQVHRQAKLKALSGFTGHAQKDSVLRFPAEMCIQVGHSTTLHCNFSSSYADPYICWYQQHQTQSPKMLLGVSKYRADMDSGWFSCVLSTEDSQELLHVRDAELQVSTVYFCALSPHWCSQLAVEHRNVVGALRRGCLTATNCV